MPSTFLIVVLSSLLVALSHPPADGSAGLHQATPGSSDAENELRAIITKIWEDAVKGDTAALRAIHFDSPKFSKFGPRIATRQDVKSTNETETEHFLSITDARFEIEDLKIDVLGDVAVTTFYNNYSFIKNKTELQGKGRVTLVFVKTEGGWKIVHEHSSPFDP